MQNNPEVLSGLVAGRMRDGRCRYDPQVKQELVGQCMLPGVSVARMAMQHGVNANLLRAWISKWKTKSQSSQAITVRRAVSETATWDVQEVPAFVPVQVQARQDGISQYYKSSQTFRRDPCHQRRVG